MEISVHEIGDDVNILEVFVVGEEDEISYGDEIFVSAEVAQQLQFAQEPAEIGNSEKEYL